MATKKSTSVTSEPFSAVLAHLTTGDTKKQEVAIKVLAGKVEANCYPPLTAVRQLMHCICTNAVQLTNNALSLICTVISLHKQEDHLTSQVDYMLLCIMWLFMATNHDKDMAQQVANAMDDMYYLYGKNPASSFFVNLPPFSSLDWITDNIYPRALDVLTMTTDMEIQNKLRNHEEITIPLLVVMISARDMGHVPSVLDIISVIVNTGPAAFIVDEGTKSQSDLALGISLLWLFAHSKGVETIPSMFLEAVYKGLSSTLPFLHDKIFMFVETFPVALDFMLQTDHVQQYLAILKARMQDAYKIPGPVAPPDLYFTVLGRLATLVPIKYFIENGTIALLKSIVKLQYHGQKQILGAVVILEHCGESMDDVYDEKFVAEVNDNPSTLLSIIGVSSVQNQKRFLHTKEAVATLMDSISNDTVGNANQINMVCKLLEDIIPRLHSLTSRDQDFQLLVFFEQYQFEYGTLKRLGMRLLLQDVLFFAMWSVLSEYVRSYIVDNGKIAMVVNVLANPELTPNQICCVLQALNMIAFCNCSDFTRNGGMEVMQKYSNNSNPLVAEAASFGIWAVQLQSKLNKKKLKNKTTQYNEVTARVREFYVSMATPTSRPISWCTETQQLVKFIQFNSLAVLPESKILFDSIWGTLRTNFHHYWVCVGVVRCLVEGW